MLYESGANMPFIPPLPSPESLVQPPPIPTPDHRDPPSSAQQPQTPMNYPNYPSTPYNTTPFIPPLPSIHSTRSQPPGSYYHSPSALPISPAPPGIQLSPDFTEHPTSLQGMPWPPPQAIPPLSAIPPPPWPVQYPETGYNALNQPLPHMWPPMAPPAWPMPPGIPPHLVYSGYTPWQHPTLRPPPIRNPGNPGDTAHAAFRWTDNVDRIDPFAEGPHYGPVLEPFLARILGTVIQLNPLLAPPPGTQDDYLRWNMLFQTGNCYRTTESQRSWVKGRDAPATHPRLTHVRVISRTFPWMIQVHAHNPKLGVTCGEVLDAIATYMYASVAKKEYENFPQGRKQQILESYRFNRSTDSNAPGGRLGEGLKRLDWLGSLSMFGGLVVNDTLVKGHCGDLLPCTFELKCLSTYPLTAEEVRKQQRRLENPRHHRNWGRPASEQWPMTSGMPADLDDEPSNSSRAHLAHEHPNDLNSSLSSPWSETPTYFDSYYRSGSPSHLRSHTATSRDRSRSSHLLACLVSLDEEVREINAATTATTERLEAEKSRAERRALHRLRMATENRERAEQESARLREALNSCKLQLENAQKEILVSRRNEHRPTQPTTDQQRELRMYMSGLGDWLARDVQDRQAELRGITARVDQLREDLGRLGVGTGPGIPMPQPQPQMGQATGVGSFIIPPIPPATGGPAPSVVPYPAAFFPRRGPQPPVIPASGIDRSLLPVPGNGTTFVPPGDVPNVIPVDPPVGDPLATSTRQQPIRSESASHVRTPETSLHASPLPVRVHLPSHEHRTPLPSRDLDEPEIIYPVISSQPISVPIADGWTSRGFSYILHPNATTARTTATHSFLTSSVATNVQDSRPNQQSEPTPASRHVRWRDYVDQMSVSPSSMHGDSPSVASPASTHISHDGPVNKRPGSSSRKEIHVRQGRSRNEPSMESTPTSGNEHHDRDRHHSSGTEAENNTEQWRVGDYASSPQNPRRSFMPSTVPHPYQSPGFYYPQMGPDGRVRNNRQSRWVVPTESAGTTPWAPPNDTTSQSATLMPAPLRDITNPPPRWVVPTESAGTTPWAPPNDTTSRSAIAIPPRGVYDPQPRRVFRTESTAVPLYPPLNDPGSTSLVEYLRRQFNQPRRGSSSGTLDAIVELPSMPETPAADRLWLQDDAL